MSILFLIQPTSRNHRGRYREQPAWISPNTLQLLYVSSVKMKSIFYKVTQIFSKMNLIEI